MATKKHYRISINDSSIRFWDNYVSYDETGQYTGNNRWLDVEYFCPASFHDCFMQDNFLSTASITHLDDTECDDWSFYSEGNGMTLIVDGHKFFLPGVAGAGCRDNQLDIKVVEYISSSEGTKETVKSIDSIQCG